MANIAQMAREMEYAANLQRARRTPTQEKPVSETSSGEELKPISAIEAFFVIIFLGVFFDLPQALLAITVVGSILNIIWVPIGYLVAYIWLKLKGRSLMGGKSGNKLFYIFGATSGAELLSGGFLPGISGFVLGVMLTEKVERMLAQSGIQSVKTIIKKTG